LILSGKIALVTGASRGIGKAIAIELARDGADIVVNYHHNEQEAMEVVHEIEKLGRKAVALKADVSDFDQVSRMCSTIKEKFGRLNIIVNNAGITIDRTLKKMSQNEWNKVIDINLGSVYNITRNAVPILEKKSRIISISSVVGLYGNFGQTNYAASKAGIIGFTKSLAKELAKHETTVNAIAPGFIESEMTKKIPFLKKKMVLWMIPLKRIGKAEEIAHLVSFLASEKASYITGQVISVSGGLVF